MELLVRFYAFIWSFRFGINNSFLCNALGESKIIDDKFIIGKDYEAKDLEPMKMFRFLPHYSFWEYQNKIYVFQHQEDIKLRFKLYFVRNF